MKTLAILTNGGDTCALNASIRSIRDNAYKVGYKKIYGIRRGYQGLLDGWIDDITDREIDVRIGGSCLGSMRTSPTQPDPQTRKGYKVHEENCRIMAQRLSDYRIDVLVVIGGDGTLQSTKLFQDWVQKHKGEEGFRTFELIGFLKTIDNDIRTFTNFEGIEVALCPGFPSAVKKIVNSVEGLRVTARTAERAFAVEIMGRNAGWLAASATFGGAEILLVPELLRNIEPEEAKKESKKLLQNFVEEIAFFYEKNRNVIIAVGEGFEPVVEIESLKAFIRILKDLYGPRKKVGATELVTMIVSEVLKDYFKFLSTCFMSEDDSKKLKSLLDNEIHKEHSKIEREIEEKINKSKKSKEEKEKQIAEEKRKHYFIDNSHPLFDWKINNKIIETLDRIRENLQIKTSIVPPYIFEIRPHRTDYTPRSGHPSAYDYRLATVLGEKVGNMLVENDFGMVPALDKVVPYDELTSDRVRMVPISDIKTLLFDSDDYFLDLLWEKNIAGGKFQISDKLIDFFKTITSGPQNLEDAIHEYNQTGFKQQSKPD